MKPIFDDYGMTQWFWLARYNENLKLGNNTQIGNFTVLGCEHGIDIEDNVKIGYSCVLITNSTIDGKKGKIVLKKGCGIGANSTIMPNVTIGENSIVGSNSLVTKNIPNGEVWFGTPAKFIKPVSLSKETPKQNQDFVQKRKR